ncbi:hypothetical protein K501DRAFT_295054 [Backusella circina FSU 941]|nr:hypothetical protein K501DRAFT_295054 [Backusella circina FSU 941]
MSALINCLLRKGVQQNDVSFCTIFILQVLLLTKHQPTLFSDLIDSFEWGITTERLFYFTGLHLKCQRYNVESEMRVTEAARLRFRSLFFFFINLALQDQGLYVGIQFYHAVIDTSLNNIDKYVELTIHLLCFKDSYLAISNKYEEHLISVRSQTKSAERHI